MANKKSKIDILSIVLFSALVVALALTIVGICIAWTSTTVEIVQTTTTTATLGEMLDAQKKLVEAGFEADATLNTNAAFSIMTVIFTGLTALAFALKLFTKNKIVKFVTLICAALTIVCAIVALSTVYSLIGDSSSTVPGAGAWLLFIFGIVGGASGIVGALKK